MGVQILRNRLARSGGFTSFLQSAQQQPAQQSPPQAFMPPTSGVSAQPSRLDSNQPCPTTVPSTFPKTTTSTIGASYPPSNKPLQPGALTLTGVRTSAYSIDSHIDTRSEISGVRSESSDVRMGRSEPSERKWAFVAFSERMKKKT